PPTASTMNAERQKAMVQPSRSLPMRRTNRPPRLQQTAAAHTSAAPRSLSAPVSIRVFRSASGGEQASALEARGQDLQPAGVRLLPGERAATDAPTVRPAGPAECRGDMDEPDAAAGCVPRTPERMIERGVAQIAAGIA